MGKNPPNFPGKISSPFIQIHNFKIGKMTICASRDLFEQKTSFFLIKISAKNPSSSNPKLVPIGAFCSTSHQDLTLLSVYSNMHLMCFFFFLLFT